jgi:hypothetical protein
LLEYFSFVTLVKALEVGSAFSMVKAKKRKENYIIPLVIKSMKFEEKGK